MNTQKKFFISLVIFFALFFVISPILTADPPSLKNSVERLNVVGKAYGDTPKTMTDIVGGIIKTALALLGVIFLVLTVYGGYKWMIARGDSKEVETAKEIITRALIGLIIVLAAYTITYFVVYSLTRSAGIIT